MPELSTLVLAPSRLRPNATATFLSPNFPAPLPANLSFTHTLRAPIGHRLHVTFQRARLPDPSGACSDVLEVDDVSLAGEGGGGPRRLATLYAGGEGVNQTVSSELNRVRVTYRARQRSAAGERTRRSVGVGGEEEEEEEAAVAVVGFNISYRVYPG